MSNSFTYIIRSNDRVNKNNINTASCFIRLEGLPQQFKYFECEVVQFHVSLETSGPPESIELKADSSFGFQNGYDTNNGGFKTCAFASYTTAVFQGPFRFITDNFNGRHIKFELYDKLNNILKQPVDKGTFQGEWILVLNMKGIEN